jgi:hypothetical protein
MAGYKRLFDIYITHSFFNNEECSRLLITPISSTANLFYKADLVFNSFRGGISISYNSDFSQALLAYNEDDIQLTFKIKSNDPYFYNYTDLEHERGKTLFFDSSLARKEGDNLCLTASDFVTSADERPISDKTFINILARTDKITAPVGIINIGLSNLIPDGQVMDSDLKNRYTIKFKAQQTYWRYYIIQRNDNVFDDLIIRDSKQEVEFSVSERVKLSNGAFANRIITRQPVLLSEYSDRHFDLIGIKGNQEILLINKLDMPDIKTMAKDGNNRISDLYVYC